MKTNSETEYTLNAFIIHGLFLVFLHLKLSGAINWSWWLIFSPYLVIACITLILIIIGIFIGMARPKKIFNALEEATKMMKDDKKK